MARFLLAKALSFVALLVTLVAANPALTRTTGWSLLAWSEAGSDPTAGQQVVVVDMFDTAASEIAGYRDAGHAVICYYSAGTAEDWRSDVAENLSAWTALAAGGMSQWSDEVWLDISNLSALQGLMLPRLQLAQEKGCSGVEPDNTDCFTNTDECDIAGSTSERRAAQLAYNAWTAQAAHGLGMLVALKNTGDLAKDLAASYDFAIVEQCLQYSECDAYKPFADLEKPIFGIEYQALSESQCASALADDVQMKHCAGSPGAGTCRNNPLRNCYTNPTWAS